jgi:hypothetical protein
MPGVGKTGLQLSSGSNGSAGATGLRGTAVDALTAVPLSAARGGSAQSITSCFTGAFAMGNIDASSVVTPLTLSLTDLTPPRGGGEPNGEIGIDGIHGHRIESTVTLKIGITDALGNEPPHPVLILLELGGSPDGKLILSPGVECRLATFMWHERDAQGNLIAPNEEFDYQLGTRALYAGAAPDPVDPRQVKPVWGTPEVLTVMADPSDALPNELPWVKAVSVHPEPGRPDHLACVDGSGQACPDVFRYWNGYLLGRSPGDPSRREVTGMRLYDAYFLHDRYGNPTFGYKEAAASQPASNVHVEFLDQTATGPSFNGYLLETAWNDAAGALPIGLMQSTLSVRYPDDADWPGGGEVSKVITLQFDDGSTHELVQKQNYEQRVAALDTPFPLVVARGAEGRDLPHLVDGKATPRLVLLTLAGTEVPADLVDGWFEPSPEPGRAWCRADGSWQYLEEPGWNVQLEQAAPAEFRLSLIGRDGLVAKEAAFRVHRCPRGDHQPDALKLPACNLGPLESDGGVITSVTVNAAGAGDGGSRGYLGIELTRAPAQTGSYYILVESVGPAGTERYRIRRQGQFFLDWGDAGEHAGAFHLATVMGGEILDESFQPVRELEVDEAKRVYVRFLDPRESGDSSEVGLATHAGEVEAFDTIGQLRVHRLGVSAVFLSEPVTLLPVWGRCETGVTNCLVVPKTRLGRLKALKHSGLVSEVSTRSGRPYQVLLGNRIPVSMIEVTDPDTNVKRWYTCSPDAGDCGDHPRVPAADITWEMNPSAVEEEGDGQKVRRELEPGDPGTPDDDQWWLRGIRTTTGKIVDGDDLLDTIELVGTVYGARGSATVEVKRPRLKCCLEGTCVCTASYNGDVDVEALVIDAADRHGIPPQYLMAQVTKEAGVYNSRLNAYAFRYEATSRDFKQLVGDWDSTPGQPGTVENGVRKLLDETRAFYGLSQRTPDGDAKYLPCVTGAGETCIAADQLPELEDVELVQSSEATVFVIPGLSGDKVQLGVKIDVGGSAPTYAQDFGVDCTANVLLGSTSYCVDGDTGTIRFGSPPPAPVRAQFRRVKPVPAVVDDAYGAAIGDVDGPIGFVCSVSPKGNSIPCTSEGTALSRFTTIRQWAWARGKYDPIADSNTLWRYGRSFKGPTLFSLIKADPSFDLQANWFASASYGLMQLLPEDFRWKVTNGVPEEERQQVWDLYDPMKDSPVEKLFDPGVCVPLGAQFLVLANVTKELQDSGCVQKINSCTWERIWKHRLCVFNIGRENEAPPDREFCLYANDVISKSAFYSPVAEEASNVP